MLCQSLYLISLFSFSFSARDISKTAEPIFSKSSRKMTNGLQLNFWFLNSFGSGREIQNGHFRSTKCKMAAKWIYFSKKESCLILAG